MFRYFTLTLILLSTSVRAAIIFDGSANPTTEGWTEIGLGGVVSTDGNIFTVNTVGLPDSGGTSPYDLFKYSAPQLTTGGYTIEARLKTSGSTFNQLDGGATLMVGGNATGAGDTAARSDMILFSNTSVMWGDLSHSYSVDTTQYHVYDLTVDNAGVATFYVDGTAALTRTGYTTSGIISFGDQTNDAGVNGRMDIDYISIGAVPEPASASLMVIGCTFCLLSRRRGSAGNRVWV